MAALESPPMAPPENATAGGAPRPGRDARAREIALTALAIIDAGGLGALTMRHLAAEAGMGPMTLYWYFEDKAAVIDAISRLLDEELSAESQRVPEPGPQDWFSDLMTRVVRVLSRHHPDITFLMQSRASGPSAEPLSEEALANYEESLRRFAQIGITDVAAVQLSFLMAQGVFMLAYICRRAPGSELTADERLRAQWESLRDLPADRYPRIRAAAEAFGRREEDATLLERGIGLFGSVLDHEDHKR